MKAASGPVDVAETEVAPGVYRLEGLDGSRLLCQYVIEGDGAWLVVDAGLPETPDRSILPALRARAGGRDEPVTLVLTHPDSDHCGGTAQLRRSLRQLTVLAHEGDADLLGDPERTIAHRYRAWWESDLVGPSDERLRSTRRRLGPSYELDRVIAADVDVDVGGRRCTILHVPGHSPGHLAVWLPAERVAIVGDAAMGRGIPYLDGSLMFAPQYHDPERYVATLGRLARLDPDVLLGAHFPPLARQRRRLVPRGQRGGRAPDRRGRPGGASCGRLHDARHPVRGSASTLRRPTRRDRARAGDHDRRYARGHGRAR